MMQAIEAQALAQLLQGECSPASDNPLIAGISKDTRTLNAGDLYLAIKGEQFDGHEFLEEAKASGASAALVSQWQACDLAQIKVTDTLQALGVWAQHNRQNFHGPVVAVTGSMGKTSTKELIHQILSQQFNTLVTQGNLNNHIGAPLTLLEIAAEHQAAVIELGASAVGEIAHTAQLAQPNIAVITNAVAAHLEGFGSLSNIVATKGELLDFIQPQGVAVLNADDEHFAVWQARALQQPEVRVVSFGLSEEADVRAVDIDSDFSGSRFTLLYGDNHRHSQQLRLPLLGQHNVINALAAIACALELNLPMPAIAQALREAAPVAGRLQPVLGEQGQVLINDAYNANPSAVRSAIDLLVNSPSHWLVLGDMAELGAQEQQEHKALGEYAKAQGVQHLLATGRLSLHTVDGFGEGALWFSNQQELVEFLRNKTQSEDVVLVKGSRSAGMDWVVSQLQLSTKVQ